MAKAIVIDNPDDLKDLNKLTVKELKSIAEDNGIEVPSKAKKADLIALIEENIGSGGDGTAKEAKEDTNMSSEEYDDEEELKEAFDELEGEGYDLDAEDEELEEEIEDDTEDDSEEAYDGKKELEESIKAVKGLPGVGQATLTKLIKAGYNSLEAIAYTAPSVIQEDSGLGEKSVAKLVKESMKQLGLGFKTADVVFEKRQNISRVTTGSQELDDLFGGGVETGAITELYGEFRTGKTQICHQICVNAQLPKDQGGLEGNALYIDTEGTFRPERIFQMAEARDLDSKNVLHNVVYGRAYNSDHQVLLVKEAAEIIKEKNIKLIVVDSIIGHFRSEFVGRGTLANRQQTINQHLHDLQRLADIHELAVVVTNQVSSKPDVFYGNPTTHTGGNVIAHGSTIRVYLRKGKGEQRVAKIVDAPNLPEGEAVFSITSGGIRDSE